MERLDINQNYAGGNSYNKSKTTLSNFCQNEELRTATLLKHRKVSTQLKLDMMERHLQHPSLTSEAAFYRLQAEQLSSELQGLSSRVDEAEKRAFSARHRLLTSYHQERTNSCDNLKSKVRHLVSAPSLKIRRRHLMGELRAVASLSSLSLKSNSPTNSEDDRSKDTSTSSWRHPIRFLHSQIRRRIFNAKRTQSVDNLHRDPSVERSSSAFPVSRSYSSDESEGEEEKEKKNDEVDPALMAEIDDFEKMAQQYIQNHTDR